MVEQLARLSFTKCLIIGLCLGGGYWAWVYDDGHQQVANIEMAVQQSAIIEAELSQFQKALADAARYQQVITDLGSEIGRITKAMPEKFTSLELMRSISQEAKTVGAEINQINAPQSFRNQDSSSGDMFYEEMPIDVELTGTYSQMMLFLSSLSKLDKIITTKTLQIENSNRSGGTALGGALKVNMKATLFAYRYTPKSDGVAK